MRLSIFSSLTRAWSITKSRLDIIVGVSPAWTDYTILPINVGTMVLRWFKFASSVGSGRVLFKQSVQ